MSISPKDIKCSSMLTCDMREGELYIEDRYFRDEATREKNIIAQRGTGTSCKFVMRSGYDNCFPNIDDHGISTRMTKS